MLNHVAQILHSKNSFFLSLFVFDVRDAGVEKEIDPVRKKEVDLASLLD